MAGQGKVLIVDDDKSIVRVLNMRLSFEGYDTEVAVDGNTAVTLANKYLPDIILLDIAMPDETGVDVMEKLQLSDRTKDIPVIIITAYPEMTGLVKGFSTVKEFFIKPFDITALLARVSEVLS